MAHTPLPNGFSSFVPSYLFKQMAQAAQAQGQSELQQRVSDQSRWAELADQIRAKDSYHHATQGQPLGQGFADFRRQLADQRTPQLRRRIYDAKNSMNFPTRDLPLRSDEFNDEPTGRYNVDFLFQELGRGLDFLWDVYRINSIDNDGMPLEAAVNVGDEMPNAFWYMDKLFFGNGDGQVFGDFALDTTVALHEMSHGLIELLGGGLIYRGMSGALNEHIADTIAIMAIHYYRGELAHPEAHWLIGDQAMLGFNAQGKKHALRSFRNEKGYEQHEHLNGDDPQGKTMDEYYRGPRDNSGVHLNSGIPNHAFYVAATTLGHASWSHLGPIWLQSLLALGPNPTFKDFAETTLEAAKMFFPHDLSVHDAILQGWETVKVLGKNAIQIDQIFEILEDQDPSAFNVSPQTVALAREVAKKHSHQFQQISHYNRISIGEDNGEVVILVFVNEKRQRPYQRSIEGYRVVVLEEWEENKRPTKGAA